MSKVIANEGTIFSAWSYSTTISLGRLAISFYLKRQNLYKQNFTISPGLDAYEWDESYVELLQEKKLRYVEIYFTYVLRKT